MSLAGGGTGNFEAIYIVILGLHLYIYLLNVKNLVKMGSNGVEASVEANQQGLHRSPRRPPPLYCQSRISSASLIRKPLRFDLPILTCVVASSSLSGGISLPSASRSTPSSRSC